jgi:spore germination protein YaaH
VPAWRPSGKINLTWEAVGARNPDVSKIKEMRGLNVISPTWFGVADERGLVSNKADVSYVKWAHARGYKVWPLIENGFDVKRTSAFLRDISARELIVQQMLAYAQMYGFDGYNIDFENVSYDDRGLLVQFVREVAPLLREQGLIVSMDVTIKSGSLTWSMCYDRKALAEALDYMMVMAYDQHTLGSPVAGSVATLPWTEEGLRGVLEEIPAQKLLLGVPFYTRIWKEETVGGKLRITSKAYGMEQVEEIMKQNRATVQWDARAGQNLATYREGGALYKVWLEDEESVAQRVALVKKYGLAGIASWRRGFEKPNIWNVISNGL